MQNPGFLMMWLISSKHHNFPEELQDALWIVQLNFSINQTISSYPIDCGEIIKFSGAGLVMDKPEINLCKQQTTKVQISLNMINTP